MNAPITLRPLISVHSSQKSQQHPTPLQLQIRKIHDQPAPLIALISIPNQLLPMIAQLQIEAQQQQCTTLAYYSSDTITIANTDYRVVYVPPSKAEQQRYVCLSEVFRQVADIVVSDINSAGMHKLKEKQQIDNKHYVVSEEKDIYEVVIKNHSLQLVRTIQLPFIQHMKQHQHMKHSTISQQHSTNSLQQSVRVTDVSGLLQVICKYANDWQWLLCQKTWSTLAYFVLQHYRCINYLKRCSKHSATLGQSKMLSSKQLDDIRQQLTSLRQSSDSTAISATVIDNLMSEMIRNNQRHTPAVVEEMRKQMISRDITTLPQLQHTKRQIRNRLCEYNINLQYIDTILSPKQLAIHQQTIQQKDASIAHLQSTIFSLQQTIHSRNRTIQHLNDKLQTQQQQLSSHHQLQRIQLQLQQALQAETMRNQQLTLQLQSTHLLQRKSLQAQVQLSNKIMQLKHEKQGLLQCLEQLTQQNLQLVNQKQQLQVVVRELKDSVQQACQIEVRALRSIQNQAQIKTRLYRYQKYVSELKLSIRSFKKLQSQKFNYILAKNYQQYQQLQNSYEQTVAALRSEQRHSKMLNESLQRERIRLSYFEKLLTSNYQHEPIPECSDENSQTDRQASPTTQLP